VNELTIITEFGQTLDGDSRGPSPELRAAVVRQFRPAAERPVRRPGWRPVRRIGLVGGVAAAAAAAVFSASSLGLWGAPQAASAEAVVLLRHAATVAARAPVLTPSADQFIYVKSVQTAAVITNNTSVREQTDLREVWASVDGTRTGLIRTLPAGRGPSWRETSLAGCRNGAPTGSGTASARCSPTPAYHGGLPTTAGAMVTYLYRHSQGQNPPDVQAFITAGHLIRESLVRPAALAAVFRAVARIPGVTVARRATNAAGQHGVGVQQTYHGISEQLIFNPRTFAFIGEREVVVAADAGLPIGTVMDSTAILAAGVTNHPGQLPR
jgi:hypothetical protein